MSGEKIFNFNDLNDFCDKTILETQRWRDVLEIQTEDYTKLVKDNENTCANLWEIHQRVNILRFQQDKFQRDLCECESYYNAMLQRVEDLDSKMITNENCDNTPHYPVYQTAEYLNTSLNNLNDFMENVDVNFNGQQNVDVEKIDGLPSCALLISKQLQLLESLERKMYYMSNEIEYVDGLQKRIVQEIVGDLTR